jgi:hypothetical protein
MEKPMKKFLLACLVAMIASPALAAESSMSMEAPRSSSAENRLDKNVSLLVSPVGVGPATLAEQGGILGVFLTPKTILQLELSAGNTSGNAFLFSGNEYKIHSQTASLAVKRFMGNSFYFRLGADYRQLNYAEKYESSISWFGEERYKENFEFNADSWAGSLVIGNQWQFESFTIGCDWFGAALPFANTVKSETYSSNGGDAASVKKSLEDEKKHRLNDVAYMGLRFYLGASF